MSITSSNAIIVYKDNMLVRAGMPLRKFATDQSLTSDEVTIADTRMGVDGKMASGYTPNITPVTIMFEADSPSWSIIDQSISIAKQAQTVVECELVVTIPALAKTYVYRNGAIKSFTDVAMKKVLDPVTLKMDFEEVIKSL